MKLPYYVVDVFTNTRFGGNPLAVVMNADEQTTEQMQAIANEFNLSETSFVLRPKNGENTASIRIFTPYIEMPFAGHPNVGTAYVLARLREDKVPQMEFEEIAGLVHVDVDYSDGVPSGAGITTPEALSIGQAFGATDIARSLSLEPDDIFATNHLPQLIGVGAQFVGVELATRQALKKAILDGTKAREISGLENGGAMHIYTRDCADNFDWTARTFSFRKAVYEDPATGSAGGATAALQQHLGIQPKNGVSYQVEQGVDMGRPSHLTLTPKETDDGPRIEISGECIMVMSGELNV